MASQLAEILNNYRQTMPEAGAGLVQGAGTYLKTKAYLDEAGRTAQQNSIENALGERRAAAAETAASAAVSKEERAARMEKMGVLAGIANGATSPEDWENKKKIFGISGTAADIPYEQKDAFAMAYNLEAFKAKSEMDFEQEKETTRRGEWSQEMGLKRKTEDRLQKFQSQVKSMEKETGQALEIRQDPLGLDFMVLNKATKEPIAKIDADGQVTPIAATPGSPLGNTQPQPWQEYFK